MSRVYGDPVEVRVDSDGRPAGFVWRRRRYTVSSVTGHWIVNREWWQEPDLDPAQPELEFWQVEASAGQGRRARRGLSQGSYELCQDVAAGSWTLHRVAD